LKFIANDLSMPGHSKKDWHLMAETFKMFKIVHQTAHYIKILKDITISRNNQEQSAKICMLETLKLDIKIIFCL
jgi:hypothetical protein